MRKELFKTKSASDPLMLAAELLSPTPNPYFNDPVGWVHDMFRWDLLPEGSGPTAYQDEIMAAIPTQRRVSARGPHGLGKTALAAWVIHWFANTRDGLDWKVPTTASAWRQLEKYLWPEIHKWARYINWEKLGRAPYDERSELLLLNLNLGTGSASAVASDNPTAIEGAHADHILYIMDESKAIMPATFQAIEGAFSTGQAYALAISTPGEPTGTFFEIHARRPGYEDWWPRHVTLEEAISAGRVSREWAESRARQWGQPGYAEDIFSTQGKSTVYINRVLGEFASEDEAGLIPLRNVEAANERWREVFESTSQPAKPLPPFTAIGVDVARSGMDRTILAPRHHNIVTDLRFTGFTTDLMELTGHVVGALTPHPHGYAAVDVIGLGAGVVDRLREQGFDVFAFNASARTEQVDMSGELGFINMRAAAWWTMRELLDPANGFNIALPPDDRLTGDLTAPHWRVTSGGKIQVESKDDIRKRLGRSTDYGDAVVMAFALRPPAEAEGVLVYDQAITISPY